MEYLVLKELPQGQQPGETIDVTEDIGDVLLRVGAVQKIETHTTDDPAPLSKRRYQRRDLEAEGSAKAAE